MILGCSGIVTNPSVSVQSSSKQLIVTNSFVSDFCFQTIQSWQLCQRHWIPIHTTKYGMWTSTKGTCSSITKFLEITVVLKRPFGIWKSEKDATYWKQERRTSGVFSLKNMKSFCQEEKAPWLSGLSSVKHMTLTWSSAQIWG